MANKIRVQVEREAEKTTEYLFQIRRSCHQDISIEVQEPLCYLENLLENKGELKIFITKKAREKAQDNSLTFRSLSICLVKLICRESVAVKVIGIEDPFVAVKDKIVGKPALFHVDILSE
jgi:hypothetical protein